MKNMLYCLFLSCCFISSLYSANQEKITAVNIECKESKFSDDFGFYVACDLKSSGSMKDTHLIIRKHVNDPDKYYFSLSDTTWHNSIAEYVFKKEKANLTENQLVQELDKAVVYLLLDKLNEYEHNS